MIFFFMNYICERIIHKYQNLCLILYDCWLKYLKTKYLSYISEKKESAENLEMP